MRSAPFGLATLVLLALGTQPAQAQISARILLDIPILGGHRDTRVVRRAPPPSRVIVVRDYSSRHHGNWKRDARHWRPVVVYHHGGRYYPSPVRGARQVTVYHYRNQYFYAPRDRGWDSYRVRYERDDWRRYDDRRDRRDDRWDDRDDDRWDDRDDDRWDDRRGKGRDDRRGNGARRRN